MKLEPDFYQNLLKTLSSHAKPANRTATTGWGSSPQLLDLMRKLQEDATARHVFMVDRTGKQVASYGDLGYIDITDTVALVVGKVLAMDALANMLHSPFVNASIEGKRWGAYFCPIGERAILMVIFDYHTNVDLIGLRVRKVTEALTHAVARLCEDNNKV
jgi:predicted regulator of Ras-like GTPase activity (Roadblock/LC7/MglB family)